MEHHPTRKRADFHLVFLYERISELLKEEIANERETVCIFRQSAGLEIH